MKTIRTWSIEWRAAMSSARRSGEGAAVQAERVSIQVVAVSKGRLWTPMWKNEVPKGTVHSTEMGATDWASMTRRFNPAAMES